MMWIILNTVHNFFCGVILHKVESTVRLLIMTSSNVDLFFHWQIPEEIVYTHVIKILNLTLNMFLHYFVNVENYNCYQFKWLIVCETSEFILQDMRPRW